ncbi:MAG: hypothetical protein AAGH89_14855, partial [Verrucomicrobiota bacterium]
RTEVSVNTDALASIKRLAKSLRGAYSSSVREKLDELEERGLHHFKGENKLDAETSYLPEGGRTKALAEDDRKEIIRRVRDFLCQ